MGGGVDPRSGLEAHITVGKDFMFTEFAAGCKNTNR